MAKRRQQWARLLLGLCCALTAGPLTAAERPSDPQLKLALKQAVFDAQSFPNGGAASNWLTEMSKRLERRLPDPFYRTELLRLVHTEATRAQLEPELVLALIQVESAFDRFAVSNRGARGLMQIMPFWTDTIGRPDDDLFHPETNLRYGCAILRYYLDRSKGDLSRALARYNGSLGTFEYSDKVYLALRTGWQ
jgi:soluble lytic murein transglycosylase-like protein